MLLIFKRFSILNQMIYYPKGRNNNSNLLMTIMFQMSKKLKIAKMLIMNKYLKILIKQIKHHPRKENQNILMTIMFQMRNKLINRKKLNQIKKNKIKKINSTILNNNNYINNYVSLDMMKRSQKKLYQNYHILTLAMLLITYHIMRHN